MCIDVLTREIEEESVKEWQRNWTQTTKGSITKEYFPNVEDRLNKENKPHTKFSSHTNGTWEDKIILTPL